MAECLPATAKLAGRSPGTGRLANVAPRRTQAIETIEAAKVAIRDRHHRPDRGIAARGPENEE